MARTLSFSRPVSSCRDIKMMNSILRMPAMCDQFHKACKRKRSAGQLKKLQLESINHMRHHISEENQTQFFDDFVRDTPRSQSGWVMIDLGLERGLDDDGLFL